MKVAVCLCGQFRTAEQCKDNIINIFTKDRPEDIEVDFFAHTWDYNRCRTVKGSVSNSQDPTTVTEKLVSYFHPKRYRVEKMPANFKEEDGWRLGQFYSISECLKLRRDYEKEVGFEYDYIFFCRFDHFKVHSDFEEDIEQGYPDFLVNWATLPEKTEVPTLYNWFRTLEWVDWNLNKWGSWVVHDFSWFCNRNAANILEGLYGMYEELCRLFRSGKYVSSFWTNNVLFLSPEKYLAVFCLVNDIHLEEDRGTYLPGWPVRESLEGVDLNTVTGRKLIIQLVKKYGFGYTLQNVQEELKLIGNECTNTGIGKGNKSSRLV